MAVKTSPNYLVKSGKLEGIADWKTLKILSDLGFWLTLVNFDKPEMFTLLYLLKMVPDPSEMTKFSIGLPGLFMEDYNMLLALFGHTLWVYENYLC